MFPISIERLPFAFKKWWISDAVVDLPFVPVMPIILHGLRRRSASV